MNENFRKQISNIEDLVEISEILSESTVLLESISKYMKHPFDPQFSKDGHHIPMNFDKKGDTIYLLGEYHDRDEEADNSSNIEILYDAIEHKLVTSAHQLKGKGLFCGLVEACAVKKLGFDITSDSEMPEKDFLFDDRNPAILVSVDGNQEDKFVDYMFNNGVRLTLLGHVTKGEMRLDDLSFGFINSFIE